MKMKNNENNNQNDNLNSIVDSEILRRTRKFDVFSDGYIACANCGKLVDDGGFFKGTNDWGCFDCLEA